MSSRERIHHLLYLALSEMRKEAIKTQSKMIFDLTDLFQTIPLLLEEQAQNNGDYEELLLCLKQLAQQKCLGTWLENKIEDQQRQTATRRALLHRLLYAVFIEIRLEAIVVQNKKIKSLTDIFHTVSLQLERGLRGERSYDEIIKDIQERGEFFAYEEWPALQGKIHESWSRTGNHLILTNAIT